MIQKNFFNGLGICLAYSLACFAICFIGCSPLEDSAHTEGLPSLARDQISDTNYGALCSEDPISQYFLKNKILFVVDSTGSSARVDKNKAKRRAAMSSVISTYSTKTVSYGFLSFSDQVRNHALDDGGLPIFTSDINQITKAIDGIQALPDKGRKNYDRLYKGIKAYIEPDEDRRKPALSNYHIIFITDGAISSEAAEQEFKTSIQELQESKSNINFYVDFYGVEKNRRYHGPAAASFFKNLFSIGTSVALVSLGVPVIIPAQNGSDNKGPSNMSFLEGLGTDSDGVIQSQSGQTVSIDKGDGWISSDPIVYNLNAGFCSDGRVDTDSDGDGLCDRDEKLLSGFHINKRFSFNKGYSDYFYWWSGKDGFILPPCSSGADSDNDLLTDCEERFLNARYPEDQWPDIVRLNENNPDSDGDSVIDGLEVLIYLSRNPRAPMDPNNLKRTGSDGKSDLQKITKHISPFKQAVASKNSNMNRGYDTIIRPIHGGGSSCYIIRQSILPLFDTLDYRESDLQIPVQHKGRENVVLVYSLNKREGGKERVFEYSYKKMEYNEEDPVRNSLDMVPNSAEFTRFGYRM